MIVNRWTLDQLLKWIGAIVLVVMFVPMGLYLTSKVSSSTEQRLAKRGQGLVKSIAVQIVDPLLLDDRLTLHDLLHKAASADSNVRYLCIESPQGTVVSHTFDEGYPSALTDFWGAKRESLIRFRNENEPLFDISAPILSGQLGYLHLGMSRTKALKVTDQLLWLMGIVLTGAMATILIGSHLVAAKVSKPLRQLEAEVLRFSEKPQTRVITHISGIRELDSLSKCFSQMVQSLQALERERAATQQRMIHTERLAALGELAAGLAHEIHNPLDGMLESVRYLENDSEKSQRAEKYYPMLKDGLERIARVMQQMLTFARSGQKISLEPCRVTEIVEVLGMLVQPHLDGRKMRLTFHDMGSCVCLCDKQGLQQAGLNLILNAVEAAEQSPDPQVRIEVNYDSQWIYLSVEDTGPGVPEEMRERIFEPFFTTKPIGKGTGLGLAVSQQFIRAAGGDLELRSTPGKLGGARFVIKLPKVSS